MVTTKKANGKTIPEMLDVKEMTTNELIDEASARAIKANGELIIAVHEALKKGGLQNNLDFEEASKLKTENEMRLHALRAELITRGIDWIDGYESLKLEGGAHA